MGYLLLRQGDKSSLLWLVPVGQAQRVLCCLLSEDIHSNPVRQLHCPYFADKKTGLKGVT